MGIKGEALKDHGDPALLYGHLGHVDTIEHDTPGIQFLQAGDGAQCCRLSRGTRAKNDEKFTVLNFEVDLTQRFYLTESLGHPVKDKLSQLSSLTDCALVAMG